MRDVCGFACGVYEPLDPSLLPPLYVAYDANLGEPTEVVHNNLRARYEQGEPAVVRTMQRLADLTVRAREALLAGDRGALAAMIDENFELRRSICRLPAGQVEMVERARRAGASAKFAGSGGAIIGTYPDAATLDRVRTELEPVGCRVITPRIVT